MSNIDETIIGIELILIIFTMISYIISKEIGSEIARVVSKIFGILSLVGLLGLWIVLQV